jgi:hypothetical protein
VPVSYGADALECPEIGATSVPDIIGDASGGGLFITENRVDLANEINASINRVQIANPNLSWSDVQNVLVAAYCRVVARKGGLTARPLTSGNRSDALRTRNWPKPAGGAMHGMRPVSNPHPLSVPVRRLPDVHRRP